MTADDLSAYLEDAAPSVGDNAGAALTVMVDRLAEADDLVERNEGDLVEAKKIAERIRTTDLPQLMEELGTTSWKSTTSGLEVKIEEKVLASPKKENTPKVLTWLEKNGHTPLIKHQIVIDLGRGKDVADKVKTIMDMSEDLDFKAQVKRSVHAQTFAAFVREQMAEGISIPLELFGVTTLKRANFKKEKKSKK